MKISIKKTIVMKVTINVTTQEQTKLDITLLLKVNYWNKSKILNTLAEYLIKLESVIKK